MILIGWDWRHLLRVTVRFVSWDPQGSTTFGVLLQPHWPSFLFFLSQKCTSGSSTTLREVGSLSNVWLMEHKTIICPLDKKKLKVMGTTWGGFTPMLDRYIGECMGINTHHKECCQRTYLWVSKFVISICYKCWFVMSIVQVCESLH
jgi:hypothetical protein